MVDIGTLHAFAVDACGGFLLLATEAILVNVVAHWRSARVAASSAGSPSWALAVSQVAGPTSYFALVGVVIATFASVVTGFLAGPADSLWASVAVRNEILLVAASQSLFIGAVVLRARYHEGIWKFLGTRVIYVGLIWSGTGLMILQSSVGGRLAGVGDLLDHTLPVLGVAAGSGWIFPEWASRAIIFAFSCATIAAGAASWIDGRRDRAVSAASPSSAAVGEPRPGTATRPASSRPAPRGPTLVLVAVTILVAGLGVLWLAPPPGLARELRSADLRYVASFAVLGFGLFIGGFALRDALGARARARQARTRSAPVVAR